MKLFIFIPILALLSSENLYSAKKVKFKSVLFPVLEEFKNGKYEESLNELNQIEKNKIFNNEKKIRGTIAYWKGLNNIRLNEYDEGIKQIEKAIKLKFQAEDIFYEYGQALYVSERLNEARFAFRQSVKNNYKVGVSLYYIAFISQQVKDYKKAVAFYNMIEKLSEFDRKGVIQASRMQIADIYFIQVEKLANSFTAIEEYVLPQYRKALNTDSTSDLAEEIRIKIKNIEKKYDILVFKMRNGRPTSFPRYFVRGNLSYSLDDNVLSVNDEVKSSLEKDSYSSRLLNASLYSRYTFYPNSALSISPELTFSYTKYSSEENTVKQFNNAFIVAGVQFNYEHSYNKKPATTYINFDYNYRLDDANIDDSLEVSSKTSSVTISEELQLWTNNPSTFRYRFSQESTLEETSQNLTHTLIWEQLVSFSNFNIYLFNSYDIRKFKESETSNLNRLSLRADLLLPTFYGLFNPNFFIASSEDDYIENSDRGQTSLFSYGIILSRPIGEKYFVNLSYTKDDQGGEIATDSFVRTISSLNVDYYY